MKTDKKKFISSKPEDQKKNTSNLMPFKKSFTSSLPTSLDPDTPKGKIHIAANRFFTEHDQQRTSTKTIAHVSGVNPEVILSRIPSKERLHEFVLKYKWGKKEK